MHKNFICGKNIILSSSLRERIFNCLLPFNSVATSGNIILPKLIPILGNKPD